MSATSAVDLRAARNAVIAAFLGWTLDAFDFFILILTIDNVSKAFGVSITSVAFAITLTLATRAVGAFIFGGLADKFGRKPILMLVIVLYSFFEALTGLAWSFLAFMVIRTLFGIAMGGEWGIGSSLAMETIPERWRGWVSGLLQAGYPFGFLLATLLFDFGMGPLGWRGMFFVGALPALLVFFVAFGVKESPAYKAMQHRPQKTPVGVVLRKNAKLVLYGVLMMAAFNFFSHGTQDIYVKLFLGKQLHFTHAQMANAGLIFNAGAIIGGISFGFLSQKIGRRYAIMAACVVALIALWPWSHGTDFATIAIAAFFMQVGVQGAWGVVPVHLNELSPAEIRGTFPGFIYQLGNFVASFNAPIQTSIAQTHGGDYGYALALIAGIVAVVLIVLMIFGPEAYNISMTETTKAPATG
ncbi:MFS transporter [Acidocella sp.]|uniref:MFS transporter n=1 Tax=Acidocella sp. TaxID=50710 RepID=UPI002632732E|nr:MFS transporter [Acidocella sp.]